MPIRYIKGADNDRVREAMKTAPDRLLRNVATRMDTRNQITTGNIVKHHLSESGPDSLGIVTRRLSRSANARKARIRKLTVRSSIGTNVVYARPHEFGIDEVVTVRAHRRKIPLLLFGRIRSQGGTAEVRQHSRKMKLPARRMFATGIESQEPKYTTDMIEAVEATLRDV